MLTITEAAKVLHVRRPQLVDWLIAHRWCYRLGLSQTLAGYQQRIAAGDLAQKLVLITRADGLQQARPQTLVTAQGLARLSVALHGCPLDAVGEVTHVQR